MPKHRCDRGGNFECTLVHYARGQACVACRRRMRRSLGGRLPAQLVVAVRKGSNGRRHRCPVHGDPMVTRYVYVYVKANRQRIAGGAVRFCPHCTRVVPDDVAEACVGNRPDTE